MSFDAFERWEHRLGFRRSAVLGVTVWMTWEVSRWAFQFSYFAIQQKADLLGVAAVIGAATAPLAALAGYVFNAYVKGKGAPP